MAHRYKDPKKGGKHIGYGKAEDFKGTPSFSSLSSLKGFIQSRRDDLESLAYVLLYAACGQLPWQKYRVIEDHEEKLEKIIESKSNVFYFDFIKEAPSCLRDMLKYCRSLQFKEEPDYRYIESLFSGEDSSYTTIKPKYRKENSFDDVVARQRVAKNNPEVMSSKIIVVGAVEESKEQKILYKELRKHSNPSHANRNDSFTDQKHIKSFSFLKDRSQNECVVSKFKAGSDDSGSVGEGSGESEMSVSSESSDSQSSQDIVVLPKLPQNKESTKLYKPDAQSSLLSNGNKTKQTDISPAGLSLMKGKISNIDLVRYNGGESVLGNSTKNIIMHCNSKNSQRSFFFNRQSSNRLDFSEYEDPKRHFSKFKLC